MTTRQPEALRLAEILEGGYSLAWLYERGGYEVSAELRRQHALIAELESRLEAIGAGGVNGPLMGQPQAMPDLSALTERGAKAWAGVDALVLREGFTAADMATASAQGFRDGVASVAANAREPVYQARYQKGFWQDSSRERYEYLQNPENTCAEDWETRILYTRPPTSAERVEHG